MNPKTKVFEMGVPTTRYQHTVIRSTSGKFTFKSWSKRLIRRLGDYFSPKWGYFFGTFLMSAGTVLVLSLGLGVAVTSAINTSTPLAHAETTTVVIHHSDKDIQIAKDQLAAIVHKGESQGKVMKEGEIYPVFDPSRKMRARCMQVGTVRPIDCESYGPYQEKIGTIQYYAPQVYGHSVTQSEAMDIANDNDKAKDFFVTCAINVSGCAWDWTSAVNHRETVQALIDTIREMQKEQ